MKIRSDYVTNSSSSSFVVAYKAFPEFDEETLVKYPMLKFYNYMVEQIFLSEGDCETDAGTILNTKEEWEDFFKNYYLYCDEDEDFEARLEYEGCDELYRKGIKYLENGFKILKKNIGYGDDLLNDIFDKLANDEENFVILEEWS